MKPGGARWCRIVFFAVAAAAMAGCLRPGSGDSPPEEIRSRIAAIRSAILARDATGIVRDATPDWRFTGPDGAVYDRAAYLVRTTALFGRIEAIEFLDTHVDRIDVSGDRAEVELTQTMIRRERPATGGGPPARLWLRYREHHVWRRSPEGWRVESVAFLAPPDRKVLPADGAASG